MYYLILRTSSTPKRIKQNESIWIGPIGSLLYTPQKEETTGII